MFANVCEYLNRNAQVLQRNPNDYKSSHIDIAMNCYDMDHEIAEIATTLESTTNKAAQDDAFTCDTSFQQQPTLDVYKLCMDCSNDSVSLSRSAYLFTAFRTPFVIFL